MLNAPFSFRTLPVWAVIPVEFVIFGVYISFSLSNCNITFLFDIAKKFVRCNLL